jgi:hypothetical protein
MPRMPAARACSRPLAFRSQLRFCARFSERSSDAHSRLIGSNRPKFSDEERGIAKGDQRFSARQYDWIEKPLIPRQECRLIIYRKSTIPWGGDPGERLSCSAFEASSCRANHATALALGESLASVFLIDRL